MSIKRIQLIPFILLVILLFSCIEDSYSPDSVKQDGDKVILTFDLLLPTISSPVTRSLDSEKEAHIQHIDVLAFKKRADGKEVFSYRTSADNIYSNGDKKQFTAKIKKSNGLEKYRLVVIANAKEEVDAKESSFFEKSKSEVLELLQFDTSSKWETTGASFTPLPMWGETANIHTILATTTGQTLGVINMIRSVARIDFAVREPDNVFKLEKVEVHNTNPISAIAPREQLSDTIVSIPTLVDSSKPKSIYTYTTDDATIENEIYVGEARNKGAKLDEMLFLLIGGKYNNSATTSWYRVDFLSQTENSIDTLDILRNHLYKVNINSVDGEGYEDKNDAIKSKGSLMSINVQDWNMGSLSEVAFDGLYFMNVEWDKKHYADAKENIYFSIITNSPENLEVNLSKDFATPEPLPDNWMFNLQLEDSEDITYKNTPAKKYTYVYSLKKNTTGAFRTGYIQVKIGKLESTMFVRQEKYLEPFIKFQKKLSSDSEEWEDIDALVFDQFNGEVDEQTYRLVWSPPTKKVRLEASQEGELPLYWERSDKYTEPIGLFESDEGVRVFTSKPKQLLNYINGSFKSGKLNLKAILELDDKKNSVIVNSLQITQHVKEIFIDWPEIIPMDGKKRDFLVRANVPWELFIHDNRTYDKIEATLPDKEVISRLNGVPLDGIAPNEVFLSNTDEFDPALPYTETSLSIEVIDEILGKDPEYFSGWFDVSFKLTINPEVYINKRLICASGLKQDNMEANCYVMTTNRVRRGILIPVRAANGIMKDKFTERYNNQIELDHGGVNFIPKLAADTKFGAKLVWSDTPTTNKPYKGIGQNTIISAVLPVGEGENGYILVLPQYFPGTAGYSQSGNAVVAVTERQGNIEGEGDILWSWHIWATNELSFQEEPMHSMLRPMYDWLEEEKWLSLNLGACGTDGGGSKVSGNYYQWGRKDPFPSIYNLRELPSSSQKKVRGNQIFDSRGKLPGVPYNNGAARSIEEVIKAPMTFFSSVTDPEYLDEGATGRVRYWLESANQRLWNNEGRKSIFDPCPAGYRVPIHGTDRYWTNIDNPWKEMNNGGVIYGEWRDFYPAGWVRKYDGSIRLDADGKRKGLYWSASPNPEKEDSYYSLILEEGKAVNLDLSHGATGDAGFVRCIKEY